MEKGEWRKVKEKWAKDESCKLHYTAQYNWEPTILSW